MKRVKSWSWRRAADWLTFAIAYNLYSHRLPLQQFRVERSRISVFQMRRPERDLIGCLFASEVTDVVKIEGSTGSIPRCRNQGRMRMKLMEGFDSNYRY